MEIFASSRNNFVFGPLVSSTAEQTDYLTDINWNILIPKIGKYGQILECFLRDWNTGVMRRKIID